MIVHYCYSGYEGCTAKALHILGFGDTVSEVAASLNACIAPVHAQFQEHHGTSVVPIENIGIPNCCWHLKVVYTAFKLQKKPFTFKKISRERWEESLLNRYKCFLVDGLLNTSFRGRKGTKEKEQQISQLFDPEISVHGNWKHSTAVIHGFVVDDTWVWEENGIMPVKYLWISKNKPDPSKGFFRDIYNVYEVDCGERSAENLIATQGKYLKVMLKEMHERK